MTAPIAPGIVTSLSPFKVQIGSDAPGGQPCQRVAPAQIGQRGGVLILGGQRVWLGQYDKNDIDMSGLVARLDRLERKASGTVTIMAGAFFALAALARLADTVQHQAFFMACQSLYHWLALASAIAAVVVVAQRHLK